MRRFYTAQDLTANSQVELTGQVARHLVQVLRMQPGEQLHLFNGRCCYLATVQTTSKNSAWVELIQPVDLLPASPLTTHLGQAISKGDKMEWVIQKATELGVSQLTPLYTNKGDVRLKGEREAKKLEQWRQIAISACEQCGRGDLPLINPPQNLPEWLSQRHEDIKLVLHPEAATSQVAAQPQTAPITSVALLIGPEGGLSQAEVNAAKQIGFSSLRLGPRVLRTETAPLAALSLVQHWWGDLS